MEDHDNRVLFLNNAQYKNLEKTALANTYVGHDTTQLEVAYQLGIQHVLRLIREGLVRG